MRIAYRTLLLTLGLLIFAGSSSAVDTNSFFDAWFNAQKKLRTWSADFVQTRSLKVLVQPLVAKGRLWFSAPNQFRWEIGDPPQTIALRQKDQLFVIYPRLKRAEIYPLAGKETEQWRDALALLDAGFPQNRAEFERQFRLLSVADTNETTEAVLQPKGTMARKFMNEIRLTFKTLDFSLKAMEVRFSDGSSLRNDFTNSVMNPILEEATFTPRLDNTYKIVEPFKK